MLRFSSTFYAYATSRFFFHHALKSPPFSLAQSKLNSKTMKTLLTFCAFLTLASALQNEAAEKEARTIFTSGGTYYLALNTTYVIYYGILIGLGLLAILALTNVGGAQASSGYGSHNQYSRQGQSYQDEFLHQRQRRFAEGWVISTLFII